MSGKLFISYRRADVPSEALSIGQFLEREFGRGRVFMDIDIQAGANFPVVLEQQLAQCKVLVAIIGPNWLGTGRNERCRLDDPEDWVRLEIACALRRGISVIPLCVNDAKLPDRSVLPEDLHGLLDYQAAFVTTKRFRSDMAGLTKDIRGIMGPRRWWKHAAIAVLVLIVAAGAIIGPFLNRLRPESVPGSADQPASGVQKETGPPAIDAGDPDSSVNKGHQAAAIRKTGNSSPTNAVPKADPAIELTGSIKFRSDAGDFIGGGKPTTLGDADGVITGIMRDASTLDLTYHGDDTWDITLASPQGQNLAPGVYQNASRAPFNSPRKPGMSVDGAGRGCNTLNGQFTIREIAYSGTKLDRIIADFEQHCEGQIPALYGSVNLSAAKPK